MARSHPLLTCTVSLLLLAAGARAAAPDERAGPAFSPVPVVSSAAPGFGGAPAADPAKTAPAPLDIKFSQFFRQPIGDRGLVLSDTLLAADGREVRLVGYMVAQEQPQPGRFWLTPRPVRMSEHADGEADDLPPSTVTVQLDPSQQDRLIPHQEGLLMLTGRLRVGRFEDATGRVSWVRLELPAGALADSPAAHGAAGGSGHPH